MYKPGVGYYLSDEESDRFDSAVGALKAAIGVEPTGVVQTRLVELLQAIQPAFSEGEMRYAIRKFQDQ